MRFDNFQFFAQTNHRLRNKIFIDFSCSAVLNVIYSSYFNDENVASMVGELLFRRKVDYTEL